MGLDIFAYRVKHSTLKKHNLTSDSNVLDLYNAYKVDGGNYDAYFRKKWYIFTYFQLHHTPSDTHKSTYIVDKSAIKVFKDLCKDILKHRGDEDYANEKLPISTGFINIYDDCYWDSVEDCRNQLIRLYNSMGNKDLCIWDFSY